MWEDRLNARAFGLLLYASVFVFGWCGSESGKTGHFSHIYGVTATTTLANRGNQLQYELLLLLLRAPINVAERHRECATSMTK